MSRNLMGTDALSVRTFSAVNSTQMQCAATFNFMSIKANIYRPSMLAFVGFASHNVDELPVPLGLGTSFPTCFPPLS
jgi:hypothetical protein